MDWKLGQHRDWKDEPGIIRAPPPPNLFSMWSIQRGSFRVAKPVSYVSGKGSKNSRIGREEEREGGRENENGNELGVMSSDGGKILSVPGTAPNVTRDLLATSTMINKCIDYPVVDILNSSGASGNQIGSPQRKEFACVVLFIITTLQPSMLCCFTLSSFQTL